MPVPVPTPSARWRCTLCGNLTRFDVERRTHVREFVHVDLAGAAAVEQRDVLADEIDHVTCRWCGQLDSVELVARPQGDESRQSAGSQSAGSQSAGSQPAGSP